MPAGAEAPDDTAQRWWAQKAHGPAGEAANGCLRRSLVALGPPGPNATSSLARSHTALSHFYKEFLGHHTSFDKIFDTKKASRQGRPFAFS